MNTSRQDQSQLKNLDDIQESDGPQRSSRLGALLLASLGGACIVLSSVVLMKKPVSEASGAVDPLGALVEKSRSQPQAAPNDRPGIDVTFPGLLAGTDRPTTALEAVRGAAPAAPEQDEEFQLPPGHPTAPPAAADSLPVVPLPAAQILAAAGKELVPHADSLTTMARQVSRETGAEVEAGAPGGFQLQVSSFKKAEEAEAFAAALRRRGHRAYTEAAEVKGRGVWHRVRVGPFKYKRSAEIYRQEFEAKERIVTFIVSPPKTKVRVAQAELSASDE